MTLILTIIRNVAVGIPVTGYPAQIGVPPLKTACNGLSGVEPRGPWLKYVYGSHDCQFVKFREVVCSFWLSCIPAPEARCPTCMLIFPTRERYPSSLTIAFGDRPPSRPSLIFGGRSDRSVREAGDHPLRCGSWRKGGPGARTATMRRTEPGNCPELHAWGSAGSGIADACSAYLTITLWIARSSVRKMQGYFITIVVENVNFN
jgi:hypothetical protein